MLHIYQITYDQMNPPVDSNHSANLFQHRDISSVQVDGKDGMQRIEVWTMAEALVSFLLGFHHSH